MSTWSLIVEGEKCAGRGRVCEPSCMPHLSTAHNVVMARIVYMAVPISHTNPVSISWPIAVPQIA
eukprot:2662584-Rhodomonas_salina.5